MRHCIRKLCVAASALGCLLAFAPAARADRLDELKKRGTLIWGGDESGGAPYVFRKPDGKLYGFEAELAEELAKELGVNAEFKPGDWAQLPSMLDRGDLDIVLNGYESTPDRQDAYRCSRPYYVYGLQLLVPPDSPVNSWEDLKELKNQGKLRKIGVLEQTAAYRYAKKLFGEEHVHPFPNALDAMEKTTAGDLDATLQDDCFAVQFADDYPKLRFVDRPVAPGFYVALVRRDEERLQKAINDALEKIINDGRLKTIYDHWDMAGRAQVVSLRNVNEIKGDGSTTGRIWQVVLDSLPMLIQAAGVTVKLACCAMPLAIAIGILVAIGRMYGPWFVAKPLTVYVEVLRGTPLMLQLFVIYYLLPRIGIKFEPIEAAILGLAINYSAYEAEIYRAGFQAVPSGQMEAALSLGMTKPQAIWRVVLPQAFRIVIPPVANDFIALFKDTSVCSVITVIELTKQYDIERQNHPPALIHLAAVTAILYLLMSYPASLFARWTEKKLGGKKIEAAHGQVPT